MEQFIQSLVATKIEFPAFTEAIMLSHEEPKHYHYSNEINMIYRIVLGVDAKAYRISRGVEPGTVIKPYLSLQEIQAVESLQRIDIGLIEAGLDYYQRQDKLIQSYQLRSLRKLA